MTIKSEGNVCNCFCTYKLIFQSAVMNLPSAYLYSAILLVTAKIAGKHVVYVSVSDMYILVSYLRLIQKFLEFIRRCFLFKCVL